MKGREGGQARGGRKEGRKEGRTDGKKRRQGKENLIFYRELWFARADVHRKRENVYQIFLGNSR